MELGRRVGGGDDISVVCRRRRLKGSEGCRGRIRPVWCLGEKVGCFDSPTPSVADVLLTAKIVVVKLGRRPLCLED